MASHEMLERLNAEFAMAEWKTRPHVGTGDTRDTARQYMARVHDIQIAARDMSDRELAKTYPDIIERAVTLGHWRRIAPPDES